MLHFEAQCFGVPIQETTAKYFRVCTCSTLVRQHQVHMLTMFKYTEDDFREIFFLLKSGLWKFVCSTWQDKVTFLNKKQLSY